MIAFVTLYRAQEKVFETKPVELTAAPNAKLGMAPVSFSLALGQLPPGEYDCQVTVLDPTSQRGTFWQASIMLVP